METLSFQVADLTLLMPENVYQAVNGSNAVQKSRIMVGLQFDSLIIGCFRGPLAFLAL